MSRLADKGYQPSSCVEDPTQNLYLGLQYVDPGKVLVFAGGTAGDLFILHSNISLAGKGYRPAFA